MTTKKTRQAPPRPLQQLPLHPRQQVPPLGEFRRFLTPISHAGEPVRDDHARLSLIVRQQWPEESLSAEAAAAVQVRDAGERSRMLYLAERPRGRPGQLHRRGRQLQPSCSSNYCPRLIDSNALRTVRAHFGVGSSGLSELCRITAILENYSINRGNFRVHGNSSVPFTFSRGRASLRDQRKERRYCSRCPDISRYLTATGTS